MTPKEAYKILKNTPIRAKENHVEYSKALHLAMATLEKQIPKKATHEASLYRCLTCPTCKNVIDEFTEFPPGQKVRALTLHCKFCGQKLDWGDGDA